MLGMIILSSIVNIYSNKKNEINNFLNKFYNINLGIENDLNWRKEFINPIEISELIAAYVDNIEKYNIRMFISLDNNMYIDITQNNANEIIKYLYERYPY